MSKFNLNLSYKNCCILKHALRDKILNKENNICISDMKGEVYSEDMTNEKYLKELEEEKRVLEAMTEEMDQAKSRECHMH